MKPISCIKILLPAFLFIGAGMPFAAYAGPCIVPDFIGSTETQVINELDGIDCLNYGGSTEEFDNATIDTVFQQDPTSGTEISNPPGTVTVVISLGPEPTTTTTTTTTTTAAPTTTTTAAPTTTTTTMVGPPTTTTTAPTTTTTATATTTTAAPTTTTTTLAPNNDDDLFDFGGGGCTLNTTRSGGMDPIWLFLLLAPGFGILRRRTAATGSARTKRA